MTSSPSDLFTALAAGLRDHYALERELGRGSVATVFLAMHDCCVALKVLRPVLAAEPGTERLLQEIRLVAGLTHPHILPLVGSGEAQGLLYYMMPLIEGESLRDRLTRDRILVVGEAVRLGREVRRPWRTPTLTESCTGTSNRRTSCSRRVMRPWGHRCT